MKLGWYVFKLGPDGDVTPIAGFWRKRIARQWADDNPAVGHLEVHRFDWWTTREDR